MGRSGETALRRRDDLREILDGDAADRAALAGNLRDMRRFNRLLGWRALIAGEAARLAAAQVPATPRPLVLDVGCGSGDLARAVVERLRRDGRAPRVVCADLQPAVLAVARRYHGAGGPFGYLCADGLRLPFADRAADLVLCSATLHHFAPPAATRLLAELGRVAGGALLVGDLARGRWTYLAARALVAVASRNPMTRHDGAVSVLRAYTARELAALAEAAGLAGARVRQRPPGRLTLAWSPPPVSR